MWVGVEGRNVGGVIYWIVWECEQAVEALVGGWSQWSGREVESLLEGKTGEPD